MEINSETVMPFGRYKGRKSIDLITQFGIPYLKWLDKNTEHSLSDEIIKKIEDLKDFHEQQHIKNKRTFGRAYYSGMKGKGHDADYGQSFDNNIGHY